MTHADNIIIDAGRALRERVLSTSDDVDFYQFYHENFQAHGLTISDLARVSGIRIEHVMGKQRAGVVSHFAERGIDPIAAYVEQGKPYAGKALTVEEHGDPDAPDDLDAWWLENCPPRYRVHVLSEHIDNDTKLDPVTWAFRRFLGRDPAPVGHNHYTAQLAKGRPVWEIIKEIELSDEAQAR